MTNHDACNERIEKLAYLAAGLRREHHAQCGTSEHVTCFRCVAIEEYELDRIDMADQRRVRHAQMIGRLDSVTAFAAAAAEGSERMLQSMNIHPSNGIEAVTNEILNYQPKTDPDHA